MNPDATASAREELVAEVYRLYRLDRLGDLARYHLYRHTYFQEAGPNIRRAMDTLLQRMFRTPTRRPTQMVELSDLQALLTDADDRHVFGRLVFPSSPGRAVEVLAVGDVEHKEVIVRSRITDKLGEEFTVRSPIEPGEIGRLYRVYVRAGYPIRISELDRFLLVLDADEQVVGGIRFKLEGDGVVHLDGLVITAALRDRGISGALLEDFCIRMEGRGMRVVKTHFHFQHFYLRHGFQVHHRWGGLVRFLGGLEGPPGGD